jgi:hypothetical protein
VVWKLDRLGRSLKEREVDFISLTEKIGTSTPGGKLIFHLILYPASCAASGKGRPAWTERIARARFTASSRSLVACATRCNSCSSDGVKARSGWFCVSPTLVSFLRIMEIEEDKTVMLSSSSFKHHALGKLQSLTAA